MIRVHDTVVFNTFLVTELLLISCYPYQDYTPKLSDFGLAKDGPEGDDTHVSTRVLGTQGYAAPEYVMTGKFEQMFWIQT